MPRRKGKSKNPFKGLNSVRVRAADGTIQRYYYAFKGGPRLPDEYGSPEFVEAFIAATKTKKPATAATLQTLLDAFQDSAEFLGLAPRTKTDYVKMITKIEAEFAGFPLAAMPDKRTRGIFKGWRDKLAKASLRQADYAFTVLARILSWGLDRGIIDANPCEKAGRLYTANRSEAVWTIDDEEAYLRTAPEHLHLPLLLGLWTGQREGDLLSLNWAQYDGRHIRLIQNKTKRGGKGGKRVMIPIGKPLKRMLDALKAERGPSPMDRILLTSRTTPWTLNGFSVSFRKACGKAGIQGLTFHDTRGTAVTRLALAGASVPQIATLTGHSLKDVEAILEVHYLNRDPRLAQDALEKLEMRLETIVDAAVGEHETGTQFPK